MPQHKIVAIEPNLTGFIDHYYNYNLALRAEALKAGYDYLCFANINYQSATTTDQEMTIVPWFRYLTYLSFSNRLKNKLWLILSPFWFAFDLLRITRTTQCTHILITAIKPFQLLGLALFMYVRRLPVSVSIVLNTGELIRRDNSSQAGRGPYYRAVLAAMKALRSNQREFKFRVFSDSERLARALTELGEMKVVPVPSLAPRPTPLAKTGTQKIRFGYLGGARDEKGFSLFIDAINITLSLGLAPNAEFVVQLALYKQPSPTERRGAELLRKLAARFSDVRAIEGNLDPEAFCGSLADLDVLVIPYNDPSYAERTSGLLADGITAGKVIIAAGDTWGSEQVERFGGGLTFPMGDVTELCRAIINTVQNWPELESSAAQASISWSQTNNVRRLFQILFE